MESLGVKFILIFCIYAANGAHISLESRRTDKESTVLKFEQGLSDKAGFFKMFDAIEKNGYWDSVMNNPPAKNPYTKTNVQNLKDLDMVQNDMYNDGKYEKPQKSEVKAGQQTPAINADPCTADKCKLPNCSCSGVQIPGGLKSDSTPQMVVLTFQNAVNGVNLKHYIQMYEDRKNPNGCPATGTFLVQHQYTDYQMVQDLYSKRHEIGDNGVSAEGGAIWWKTASYDQWKGEIESQKKILAKWGNIKTDELRGFRAPFLQLGGDKQYKALEDTNDTYDASRTSIAYMSKPNLMWPYTMDYQSTQDCVIPPCPAEAYKGLWQIPMLAFKDKNGHIYATPEECSVSSAQEGYDLLYNKYLEHYTSNRAPYVISVGSSWIDVTYKMQATMAFLNKIMQDNDTYVVSAWQALQWIQKPTELSALNDFTPWKCDQAPPKVCTLAESSYCYFDQNRKAVQQGQGWKFSLHSCVKGCPKCYPWVNDPLGEKC